MDDTRYGNDFSSSCTLKHSGITGSANLSMRQARTRGLSYLVARALCWHGSTFLASDYRDECGSSIKREGITDMDTHEAWRAMRVGKAIGALVAASVMALAAPAGIAIADPPGPSDGTDSAINSEMADYTNNVQAAMVQLDQAQAAQSGHFTPEQLRTGLLQITTANQQLRDALQGIAGR
jgi:hypothetical protein